jgi:hypothetical protein
MARGTDAATNRSARGRSRFSLSPARPMRINEQPIDASSGKYQVRYEGDQHDDEERGFHDQKRLSGRMSPVTELSWSVTRMPIASSVLKMQASAAAA